MHVTSESAIDLYLFDCMKPSAKFVTSAGTVVTLKRLNADKWTFYSSAKVSCRQMINILLVFVCL